MCVQVGKQKKNFSRNFYASCIKRESTVFPFSKSNKEIMQPRILEILQGEERIITARKKNCLKHLGCKNNWFNVFYVIFINCTNISALLETDIQSSLKGLRAILVFLESNTTYPVFQEQSGSVSERPVAVFSPPANRRRCLLLVLLVIQSNWSILHMTLINPLKDYYQLNDKHIRAQL